MDKVSARQNKTITAIGTAFLYIGLLVIPGCAPMESSEEIDTQTVADNVIDVYQPREGIDSKKRFRLVLELLASGEITAARTELEFYLQGQPNSARAQDLLKQIDTPATEYFPKDYRELTLSSGQSLSSVAKSFLGSVYKFHALAKYNGISEPGKIGTGQTIRVPLTDRAVAAFQALESIPLEIPEEQDSGNRNESSAADLLTAPRQDESPNSEATAKSTNLEAPAVEELKPVREDAAETPDVEEMHLEALNAYRAQDLSRAIELWDQVLEIDPEYESSRLYRSQAVKLQNKLRNFD